MRLISLTANQDSFKPVYFNKSGITLIIGRQNKPEEQNARKTYNGVGKSLIIALIHFCLGAGTNAKLEDAIPDWEFNLKFEVENEEYTVSRGASSQNKITFNGDDFSVAKFNAELEKLAFHLPQKVKGLTFKSLLNRFIRPSKSSYVSFDKVHDSEAPYYKLLCQSFLLGLDIDLVTSKYNLKTRRDAVKGFRDNLSKDSVLKEFFTESKDVEIELRDLEDKITQLSEAYEAFQVADNYHQIRVEAHDTKNLLLEAQNEEIIITNAINSINLSLEVRTDISPDKLLRIYNETQARFPDSVVKDIQEVSEFHNKLLANRIKRLAEEKSRLENELKAVRKVIISLKEKRNSQLRFLGSHGAFDDMLSVSNQLNEYKMKAQKIKDYKELIQKYSDETQEINIELSNETKRTNLYLNQASAIINGNLDRFRSFSKRFYNDKPGGLTVKNNEGDNQIRFDINAHIQDDASDGINEVKIFCFDMTLLMQHHNHNIKFLFHDSRLFSNMDPRQRATSFKIANDCIEQNDIQYIASLNEDQMMSMKEWLGDDFENIITDNIVLELTDESPDSKLLGIEVDMQYE